jgi:hypothetical protein
MNSLKSINFKAFNNDTSEKPLSNYVIINNKVNKPSTNVNIKPNLLSQYINKTSPGVFISVNFNNGHVWSSPIFTNLVDAINYLNDYLTCLLKKISKLIINTLTIVINPGDSYVEIGNKDDFTSSGIYNSCSDIPILDLYIGNTNVIINKFVIGGSGGSNMLGSCKITVYNLCSLKPDNRDSTRTILKLPKIVFQNFIWIGSLWIDFKYTNLTGIDVDYNSYGMSSYSIDGKAIKSIPSTDIDKYPWILENLADSFIMTNVTVQIPVSTLIGAINSKNQNIIRIKPLFYFNSFSVFQNQIWSCNIYSYASANKSGSPPPLVYLSEGLTLGNYFTEYLLNNNKFSGEVFGQYLPICLQIDNTTKVAIVSSILTGQIVIQSNTLAISSCYLLAIGTIDGLPLSETNPVAKSIIYNCNNPNNTGTNARPGGVVAPSRFVLNGNEFISNVYSSLSPDSYSTSTKSIQNLPWSIENLDGIAPISKFSSTLYWHICAASSPTTIKTYDAILLTNNETADVKI